MGVLLFKELYAGNDLVYDPIVVKYMDDFYFEAQAILDGSGKKGRYELLARFTKYTLVEVFNVLEENNLTFELLKKVMKNAFSFLDSNKNTDLSINAYISDICSEKLIEYIDFFEKIYPKIDKKNLTFEILEKNYGELDNRGLRNIKELKKRGYKIWMDDVSLDLNDTNNKSVSNLAYLIENSIIPDGIKICGKYMEKLFKDFTIHKKVDGVNEMKEFIFQLKHLGVKDFVGEWIKGEFDATLARFMGCGLFQGMYLNEDEFRIKIWKKVDVIDMKFMVYHGLKK